MAAPAVLHSLLWLQMVLHSPHPVEVVLNSPPSFNCQTPRLSRQCASTTWEGGCRYLHHLRLPRSVWCLLHRPRRCAEMSTQPVEARTQESIDSRAPRFKLNPEISTRWAYRVPRESYSSPRHPSARGHHSPLLRPRRSSWTLRRRSCETMKRGRHGKRCASQAHHQVHPRRRRYVLCPSVMAMDQILTLVTHWPANMMSNTQVCSLPKCDGNGSDLEARDALAGNSAALAAWPNMVMRQDLHLGPWAMHGLAALVTPFYVTVCKRL